MPALRENDLRIVIIGAFVFAALGLLVMSDSAGNRNPLPVRKHPAPEFLAADFYDR